MKTVDLIVHVSAPTLEEALKNKDRIVRRIARMEENDVFTRGARVSAESHEVVEPGVAGPTKAELIAALQRVLLSAESLMRCNGYREALAGKSDPDPTLWVGPTAHGIIDTARAVLRQRGA